jgi:hypothetical protein
MRGSSAIDPANDGSLSGAGKLLYSTKSYDIIMLRFNPKTDHGQFYIILKKQKNSRREIQTDTGEVLDINHKQRSLPVIISQESTISFSAVGIRRRL